MKNIEDIHLKYIKNNKPQFPLLIPSHKRPDGDLIKACIKEKLNPIIYIDDIDPIDEYKKTGCEIVVGPKRTIAEKRFDMIEDANKRGFDFIWMIDDDLADFSTKNMDNKKQSLTVTQFLSSAEQFIDIKKDAYCKFIIYGLLGLHLFGPNKTYRNAKLYAESKGKPGLIAGCFGLNIKILKQFNIQFDKNCPHGCGEDIAMTADIYLKGLSGKNIYFISYAINDKIESLCWNDKKHTGKSTDDASSFIRHREAFNYLRNKYGNLIKWHQSMGATINSGPKVIDTPDWYVEKKFKFGS